MKVERTWEKSWILLAQKKKKKGGDKVGSLCPLPTRRWEEAELVPLATSINFHKKVASLGQAPRK